MDSMHVSQATDTVLLREYAEAIRAACVEAAISGYERAAISGLCREGAFEAAISAMRMVDLETIRNKSS